MSSTARVTERIAGDQYPSQRWMLHRLLERCDLPGGLWLEPCAGAGALIRAVSEVRSDVTWNANELYENYNASLRALSSVYSITNNDARTLVVPKLVRVILTNPSFSLSLEILEAMLSAPWATTVFLQRLNWAAGPRADLFRAIKPSVYVLPDRASFVDMYDEDSPDDLRAQTDSIEYGWYKFDGRGEFHILGDTPAEIRRAEIEEGRANGTRPKKVAKRREKEAA